MLVAKPLRTFTLGSKQVVVCAVTHNNPNELLATELWYYRDADQRWRVRIEGLSTASNNAQRVYDFRYEGRPITDLDITDQSVITDGPYAEAILAAR